MSDRYKLFSYEITTDKDFFNDEFGITPDLQEQFESLYYGSEKGGGKIIKRLIELIEKYPHVPHLKNYLMVAYTNSGENKKAVEVNHWLIREHPDYLFGKLNLAAEYYLKEEYDKIPEVLGKLLEIKDLYPDRKCFHLAEVTGFYKLAIMYFSAVGNIEAAESRYEILEELAPGHPDTEAVFPFLMKARLESVAKRMLEEDKNKIKVKAHSYNKEVQTEIPPEFIHKEINWLYESGLRIEKEKLKQILSLPYDSVVADLITVLQDAIYRYEYFRKVTDDEGWQEDKMSFALHSFYLLGELRAGQSLPVLLETFQQGEEFIEFWYGDHILGHLWEPLYYIADNQLTVLKEFVLLPVIYYTARSEVCKCVGQIAHHQPGRKNEVLKWYSDVFKHLGKSSLDDGLIDSDFIGLAIWNALELCAPILLPEIKDLFDLGYVSENICGTYEDVKRDITNAAKKHYKKELLDIYNRYYQIITTWAWYTDNENNIDFHDDDYEYLKGEPVRAELKTGRNDPCPCGSGKKYKKCCLKK